MAVCKTFIEPARKHWGWPTRISSAVAGGRVDVGAHCRSGKDLHDASIQWPRYWGHHGGVQDAHWTRAEASHMATVDLIRTRGRSPTRGRTSMQRGGLVWPEIQYPRNWADDGGVQDVHWTRAEELVIAIIDLCRYGGWSLTRGRKSLQRGGLVWPERSKTTQLGTRLKCERCSLDRRGSIGDGHRRSFSHSRVVANPWAHVVAARWKSRARAFKDHSVWEAMAKCKKLIGPARKRWGWRPLFSVAIAGGREPVDACRCSEVHFHGVSIQ